jgi:hypothetical protein
MRSRSLRHQRLHRRAKAANRAAGGRGHAGCLRVGQSLPERAAGRIRVRDDTRERGVADAAPRPVRDTQERAGVAGVDEHGEVSGRIADLRALVEPRPADDLVRDVLPHEHVLQHPRLRVRPVKDCDLARREPLVDQPRDLGGDEPGFGVLVLDLDDAYRVTFAEIGEEVLGLPVTVVLDNGVRRAQDRVRRAVVLLERDHVRPRKVAFELRDVADVGSPEGIDRLILVPDCANVLVLGTEEL